MNEPNERNTDIRGAATGRGHRDRDGSHAVRIREGRGGWSCCRGRRRRRSVGSAVAFSLWHRDHCAVRSLTRSRRMYSSVGRLALPLRASLPICPRRLARNAPLPSRMTACGASIPARVASGVASSGLAFRNSRLREHVMGLERLSHTLLALLTIDYLSLDDKVLGLDAAQSAPSCFCGSVTNAGSSSIPYLGLPFRPD